MKIQILNKGEFKGDIYGTAWDKFNQRLLLAGDQKGGNDIFESNNLESEWEEVNFHGGGINHIKDVVFNEERNIFYTVNHNGKIHEAYKSGSSWTTNNIASFKNLGKNNIQSTTGEDKLVFVESDDDSSYVYTVDLNDNSKSTSYLYDLPNVKDVAYGNGKFIVVGEEDYNEDGRMYISEDGLNWEQVNFTGFNDGDAFNSITWTGEEFLVAGDYDRILRSKDGSDWESVDKNNDIVDFADNITIGIFRHYDNIAANGDLVIASSHFPTVKEHGTILVSTNGGENWIKYETEDVPKFRNIISLNSSSGSSITFNSWRQLN